MDFDLCEVICIAGGKAEPNGVVLPAPAASAVNTLTVMRPGKMKPTPVT